MDRRQLLSACGIGLTTVLAGCTGSSSSDDAGDDTDEGESEDDGPAGPKEVVRNYLQTVYGGTAAEINAFIHPDAELPEFTSAQTEQYDGRSINVESMEIVDRTETMVKVRTTVVVDTDERRLTDTAVHELRKADGKWKMYDTE